MLSIPAQIANGAHLYSSSQFAIKRGENTGGKANRKRRRSSHERRGRRLLAKRLWRACCLLFAKTLLTPKTPRPRASSGLFAKEGVRFASMAQDAGADVKCARRRGMREAADEWDPDAFRRVYKVSVFV